MKPTDITRLRTCLTALRARLAALFAEREEIHAAGPNAPERAAIVLDYCRQAGRDGDARLAYLIATGDIGRALMVRTDRAGTFDLGPLLAAVLGPEELAAALTRHIAPGAAPDAATRAARLVAIDAELDRLEREEEVTIVRSEAAGSPIPRRADARPEIVLEVVA